MSVRYLMAMGNGIREDPESPEWDFTNGKTKCVRVYNGKYAALHGTEPPIGVTMPGTGYLRVVSVKTKKRRAALGVMTVQLEVSTSDSTTNALYSDENIEIAFAQLERPLLLHPIFDEDTNGKYKLTAADHAALICWEQESNAILRAAGTYHIIAGAQGSATATLSDNAKIYAKMRRVGIESYLEFPPVVRRTRLYNVKPAVSLTGCRFTASFLSNYLGVIVPNTLINSNDTIQYLKTADRMSRSGRHGKWDRSEEWTGSYTWNKVLYPLNAV